MHSTKFRIIASVLTLAGAIPFIGFTLGIASHTIHTDFYFRSLITYAAIILAFLSGIHWGLALNQKGDKSFSSAILLESVIPALLAWSVLLITLIYWQLIILCVLFFLILLNDILLYRKGVIESWFLKLRFTISAIVLTMLIVSLIIFKSIN